MDVTLTLRSTSLVCTVVAERAAPDTRTYALADVLGVRVAATDASHLELLHFPVQPDSRERVRRVVLFKFNSPEHCASWRAALATALVTGTATAPVLPRRHVLVLVNPYGGTKKAQAVWERVVAPVFADAGLTCEVVATQYSGHAYQLARAMQLDRYDGVCTVSGDGLVMEVVNGLAGRPDGARAARMPLLLIPAGSGNALCFSALRTVDPLTAAFVAARGYALPLDASSVCQGPGLRCLSTLMLSWGLIAGEKVAALS